MYQETHALDMPPINTQTLSGNGIVDLGQSTFKADPFGFDVLANKVYSKKPTAIFREVSTNGVDGNKAIGLEHIPILVKFPNELSPSFFIQDCGPGLSEEQVKELILVFFASGKRNLTGMTGQFGVGAKSPFAYATEFQIECAHAGMLTSYLFYKDSDRIPKMKRLTNPVPVSSDFPHGVRVTIPVKPEDYAKFEAEGLEVLRWFEVPPIIKGTARTLDIPKYVIPLTENVSAVSSQDSVPHSSVWMSNVRYPVNFNSILSSANKPDDVSSEDFESFKRKFQSAAGLLESVKFILKAPSRAVDVPISREHLEETAKTIGFVMNEVVKAGQALAELVRRALTEKTTITWDSLLLQREQDTNAVSEINGAHELDIVKSTILQRKHKYKVSELLGAYLDEATAIRLQEKLELQLTKSAVELPRWAGDIKGENPLWSLECNKPLLVDLNDSPLDTTELEEFPRKPFVALSILSRSEKTVQFEAIERGEIRTGSKVGLYISKETSIFIADVPQAAQRFKQNNFPARASALLVSCSNLDMAELYAELLSDALCGVPIRMLSELPLVRRKRPTTEKEALVAVEKSKVSKVEVSSYEHRPFTVDDYSGQVDVSSIAGEIDNICFVFKARSRRSGVNLGLRGKKETSTIEKKKRYGYRTVTDATKGAAIAIHYAAKAKLQMESPEFASLAPQEQNEIRALARMTNVYSISVSDWRLLKQAKPEAKTFGEVFIEQFGTNRQKLQSLFKTQEIVRSYDGPNPRSSRRGESVLTFSVFRKLFLDETFSDALSDRLKDPLWEEKCVKSGWFSGLQHAISQFRFYESSQSSEVTQSHSLYLKELMIVLREVEWLSPDKEVIEFLTGTRFSHAGGFTEIFDREKEALLDDDRFLSVKPEMLFKFMDFCFK